MTVAVCPRSLHEYEQWIVVLSCLFRIEQTPDLSTGNSVWIYKGYNIEVSKLLDNQKTYGRM